MDSPTFIIVVIVNVYEVTMDSPTFIIVVIVNVYDYFTMNFLPSLTMRPLALLFRRWPAML